MSIEQNQMPENDLLEQVTAALREAPISNGPTEEAILLAEKIATTKRPILTFGFTVKLIAACLGVTFLGLFAYLVEHSGTLAFADVAKTITDTRSFTATLNESGAAMDFQITVKGRRIRVDTKTATAVIDEETGKVFQLLLPTHVAQMADLPPATLEQFRKYDLYAMARSYQTGNVKSIGEKTIDGRKLKGFELGRKETQAVGNWTFWVDPQTRLPVEIEVGPIVATHLRFDVPVDESLFEMKVPAGYTIAKMDEQHAHLKYSGQVLDVRGKPVAGVEVTVQYLAVTGGHAPLGNPITTDRDGRFTVDQEEPFWNKPTDSVQHIRLVFSPNDLLGNTLEDVNLQSLPQQKDLHVVLQDGTSVTGVVVDAQGNPVAGARVWTVFGKLDGYDFRSEYGKSAATDKNGQFKLLGLLSAPVVLQVQKVDEHSQLLCGQTLLNLQTSVSSVEMVMRPFTLPTGTRVFDLQGMKLVNVTDALREQLSLWQYDKVLVVDPGEKTAHAGGVGLQPGDVFWRTEAGRFKDFREMAQQILKSCHDQKKGGRNTYIVTANYDFVRTDHDGSTATFLHFDDDDLGELEQAAKQ